MITFDDVSFFYPSHPVPALARVSVQVGEGEFAFLVGQSGSGKSTFLRLVLRELVATHGRVLVGGQDLARVRQWRIPQHRRTLGTVFQDFRLLPGKTVDENVAFALQVTGHPTRDIRRMVPETLELVGLGDKGARLPEELSGGEQQRVAIARAVVNHPRVLIADEPTGNLDPATSADILQVLERINATGTTVVMATHDATLVDQMRHRVLELDEGRLVRDQAGGGYDAITTAPGRRGA